ncbi:Dyp-type peroxidase [Streptomyces sp. NPDC090135]|uniref:Dyp-type peroxidase n=1 Tax=Streptomyces sp. NPDC090135 TaxID=3365957 RepID=UPI0037F5EE15
MTETSRRHLLRTSLAVAAATGAGGLCAADVAALRSTSESPNVAEAPAHLRSAAPLPHAQLLALDLGTGERSHALRAAQETVSALDGGDVAAWLALGESLLVGLVHKPRHLKEMPAFPGDLLDSAQSHGDLLLQVTATSAETARKAGDRALRELRQWRIRWRMEGVRLDNRTEDGRGLARNPFHFNEGYGNPDNPSGITERAVVTSNQEEPDWAVGGSYQVVRIIRLATAFWDRDTIQEQERIIGRRRDGQWLDGTPSTERPVFASDPHGRITPLDAHVRRAAPDRRHPPFLVRRSYGYDRGDSDRGMLFSCFQRDLSQGFESVQKRLQGEAMAKYALTIGGGYFFVPAPGPRWLEALA